ncbi:uncharacterized protein LOC100210059 isoform X2 [Hydra vulgaris]|uniref:Uncharacterized protein LOC100210059 isoform X2 n=1 Tax=Hydra vulgaris TaxID=6087 RepID=A0ABM4BI82_HYDVU
MNLINFLKFSSPIMDYNTSNERKIESNMQNDDNTFNIDFTGLDSDTRKTYSAHLTILDECENSWRNFYEKFNQSINKTSQDNKYDLTKKLLGVSTNISETIHKNILICHESFNSTKESEKSHKSKSDVVRDLEKENAQNQENLKNNQLFSVINNPISYNHTSWSSYQDSSKDQGDKNPDTTVSSECKNDGANDKKIEHVVSLSKEPSNRINVSNVLEKIDRVDDIDTNMYKPIECTKTGKALNQIEYKETSLGQFNRTNLYTSSFLPKAFDIWSEKYRPLVLSEFPNANEKTISEKLFEVWHKIPPKFQSKYYVKADEICKEYLNYKHEFNNSSTKKFNSFKTSTEVLKPKALRFNSIENKFTECKSFHSDVNQLIYNEETNPIDYSTSLKKTMPFDFADKHMKKRISKKKFIDYDIFDENLTAAGYLEDILLSQQNSSLKSNSNCNVNNSYESIINSFDFDMHELDCYLRGDNSELDTNGFLLSMDTKYRSIEKRKKKDKKGPDNNKIKRNNVSKIEAKIKDLQDVRLNKKITIKSGTQLLENETINAASKRFVSLKNRKVRNQLNTK